MGWCISENLKSKEGTPFHGLEAGHYRTNYRLLSLADIILNLAEDLSFLRDSNKSHSCRVEQPKRPRMQFTSAI